MSLTRSAALALALVLPLAAGPALAQKSAVITAFDPDKDGTLDAKEAKGVLSPNLFKSGDPDKDGTIDKAEYLALVEAVFKDADPDNDGTLDAKELKSKPGKALVKLIK